MPVGYIRSKNRQTRLLDGITQVGLSLNAGVPIPGSYDVETGGTLNPLCERIDSFKSELSIHLPHDAGNEIKHEANVGVIGELLDFDPHDPDEHPTVGGIYVFYDISERPLYVGQGKAIDKRIRDHNDKFWFRPPIVQTASYVQIDDRRLRERVEAVLIKFLKSNAVINKQLVDR
jgi:hypothetical protein